MLSKFYWGEADVAAEDFIDSKTGLKVLEIIKQESISEAEASFISTYIANFCRWCSYADFLVKYFTQTVSATF